MDPQLRSLDGIPFYNYKAMYIIQIIYFFSATIVGEFKVLSIKKKKKELDMMLLFCTQKYIYIYIYIYTH